MSVGADATRSEHHFTIRHAEGARLKRQDLERAHTMTAVASMDVDATSVVGLRGYYKAKIESMEVALSQKTQNLRRLEAQRNELNTKGARLYSFDRDAHE